MNASASCRPIFGRIHVRSCSPCSKRSHFPPATLRPKGLGSSCGSPEIGVSAVILLMRSDVKQSAAIFRRNIRQIRHWLEEESASAAKEVEKSKPKEVAGKNTTEEQKP